MLRFAAAVVVRGVMNWSGLDVCRTSVVSVFDVS